MIGRTNAGGGGGLQDSDALLRVMAPAGSVVTITKGGMTKTDHGHENALDPSTYDYYFIIHQSQFDSLNAWTVTATLNGSTASKTIIIDAADEYDVTIIYGLWLYDTGTNFGLIQGRYADYAQKTVTFGTISIRMAYSSGSGSKTCSVISQNTINLTNYSTAHIVVDVTTRPTSDAYNALGLTTTSPTYSTFVDRLVLNNADLLTGEHEYIMDISSYTGNYYVFWHCNTTSTSTSLEAFIRQMWLES